MSYKQPTPELPSSSKQASIFPVREYIDVVMRRRWGFILAFALVMVLGVLYTLKQPKFYLATTAVIINPEPATINPLDSNESQQQWYLRDTYYDTQLRVMQSRHVAQRVIDDLGLAADLDFLGLSKIKDPDLLEKRLAVADPVATLLLQLKVEAVIGTRLVNIKVQNENPELAAKLANAIAVAYAEQNSEHRLSSLNSTFEFIDKQFKDNENSLQQARQDLNAFKEKHKILYSNPIEQQKITNQRLDYLNNKRVEIETRRQHAGYNLAELKKLKPELENVRAFAIVADVPGLNTDLALCEQMRREMKTLLVTYHENASQVVAIRDQIVQCEAAVIQSMKSSLQGQVGLYDALVKVNQELNQEIVKLQKEALELDQLRLLYEEFESQKAEKERLFEQSQKKLNEVSLNRLLDINNIRILDTAIAPRTPVSPNLLINGGIALFAALIAGFLIVVLLELLDITIRTQEDVEERARLPFLGAIPKFPKSRRYAGPKAYRYVIENPNSPITERIRTLRTTLSFLLPPERSQIILITSAQPLEGKTMTSLNIAVTSALAGQRVILLEADLRRPRIYKVLKTDQKSGLAAVIEKKMTLDQALFKTEVEGLDLLPCGEIPENPADLFQTEAFHKLLRTLQERYDRIIIDSPPVTVVTDALIMAQFVHGVIIIARSEKTPLPLLIRTRELLEGVNAPILGVVLNDMRATPSHGYGGYYYYTKAYSEDKK